jgi:MFS family permease
MQRLLASINANHPLALMVVGFCFGVGALTGGLGQTFNVFLLSVSRDLALDRGEIASVYSITVLTGGLLSPLAGALFDRHGPLRLYGGGLALIALGYWTAASATSLWTLYLGLGLLGGIGNALTGGVSHAGLVSRWFTAHPGTAMGVIFSAGAFATVLAAPLAALSIANLGWRLTWEIYAALIALAIPVIFLMPWPSIMRGGPGWHGHVEPAQSSEAQREVWTLASAMRTPTFWGLFSSYFFTGAATVALIVHMPSYLVERGYDPLTAATAAGAAGFFTPFGMIGFGILGDRIGRARAAGLSYVASALAILGLFLISFMPSLLVLVPTVFFFGVSSGSRGPVVSAIAMNIFAGRRMGGIFGTISLGGGLGSAFGTWMGGELQVISGSPDALIYFTAVALFLGSMPFWTVGALKTS